MKMRSLQGSLVCAFAACLITLMPLLGVLHGLHCHDGGHGWRVIDSARRLDVSAAFVGSWSASGGNAAKSRTDESCGHDRATCPICQALVQLATAVIWESAETEIPAIGDNDVCEIAKRIVVGGTPHAVPFSRAPPSL